MLSHGRNESSGWPLAQSGRLLSLKQSAKKTQSLRPSGGGQLLLTVSILTLLVAFLALGTAVAWSGLRPESNAQGLTPARPVPSSIPPQGLPFDSYFMAHTIPTKMGVNERLPVQILILNYGTQDWNATDFALAVTTDSAAIATTKRIRITSGDTVGTIKQYRLTTTLKAPATARSCSIEFQMVRGASTFFGRKLSLTISAVPAADIVANNLALTMNPIPLGQKALLTFNIRNAGAVPAPAYVAEIWASPDPQFWASRDPAVSGWIRVATTGPSPRNGHAMVFDSRQNKIILFGGFDNQPQGDTWEYTPARRWVKLNQSGPSPRSNHAMAYDSARGKIVLFGGDDGQLKKDTWEYTPGAGWKLVSTAGPSARSGQAMVYDSVRGKVVLFGGNGLNNAIQGDTWEYTPGAGWKLVATGGPAPRASHAMAYDSLRRRILMFGGRGYGLVGDFWQYIPGQGWSRLATPPFTPRDGSSMVYDDRRDKLVLFGGRDDEYRGETWEYRPSTGWVLRPTLGPTTRAGQSMAYDSVRGKIVIFSGWDSYFLTDTWELLGGGNDIFLGEMVVAPLAAGASRAVAFSIDPRAGGQSYREPLPPGKYYLAILADTRDHVNPETNEENVFILTKLMTILRPNAARAWTAYD